MVAPVCGTQHAWERREAGSRTGIQNNKTRVIVVGSLHTHRTFWATVAREHVDEYAIWFIGGRGRREGSGKERVYGSCGSCHRIQCVVDERQVTTLPRSIHVGASCAYNKSTNVMREFCQELALEPLRISICQTWPPSLRSCAVISIFFREVPPTY